MPAFNEAMYVLSDSDYEPISTQKDLNDFLGRLQIKNVRGDYVTGRMIYNHHAQAGQRMGQAFMNALPEDKYDALTGTRIDPFHKDDLKSLLIALDYLLLKD